MSIICKLFIQSKSESPDGSGQYHLGVVCRGDENKDWAAATPSGSMKTADPVLADLWAARRAGERDNAEVYVRVILDSDGDWSFEDCAFSYGGCTVKFRQKGQPWGDLSLTVNASAATASLRSEFAASLAVGTPARYRVEFEPV